MRSFTTSDLPGRCPRCWVMVPHCVCAEAPRVSPRTGIVIVRHQREGWKSTGTARAAALAIPSLSCVEYGEDTEPAASTLAALPREGTFLLFPARGVTPAPWEGPDIHRLILLDGTWRQTRRMFQRLTWLHGLPTLCLHEDAPEGPRLRQTTLPSGRATLEALAEALERLEGAAVSEPLHRFHRLFVERILTARGTWR